MNYDFFFQELTACNTRGGPVYLISDKVFLIGLMPRDNVFEFIPSMLILNPGMFILIEIHMYQF